MQCGVDDPGFHLIYVYNLYVYIHIVYIYKYIVFIYVYMCMSTLEQTDASSGKTRGKWLLTGSQMVMANRYFCHQA